MTVNLLWLIQCLSTLKRQPAIRREAGSLRSRRSGLVAARAERCRGLAPKRAARWHPVPRVRIEAAVIVGGARGAMHGEDSRINHPRLILNSTGTVTHAREPLAALHAHQSASDQHEWNS